jgi:hypothetical protein
MYDLFLSYAHHDHDLALRLLTDLQESNLSVWWDVSRVPSAAASQPAIKEGLAECISLIALISPEYITSPWAISEMQVSLATYRLIAQRFTGFYYAALLAVTDPSVYLPTVAVSHLEPARQPFLTGDFSSLGIEDPEAGRFFSLIKNSYEDGSVQYFPGLVVFPYYPDNHAAARRALNTAISVWRERRLEQSVVGGRGAPPPPLGGRPQHLRALWQWVPGLARYDEEAMTDAVSILDAIRGRQEGPDGDPAHAFERRDSEPIVRVAEHLWDNRRISLVADVDSIEQMSYLSDNPYATVPLLGTPTDNLIYLCTSGFKGRGILRLEEVYRDVRHDSSAVHDLFDLSLLAAIISAYSRWWGSVATYAQVRESILVPLGDGGSCLDPFY